MSDLNVAAVRTTLPAAWTTVIAWLIARFGLNVSEQDMAILLVIVPVVLPVVYRAFREVERRWPAVGRVLFGSAKTPTYTPPAGDGGSGV